MNTNTLPRPTRRPRRALLELTPTGLDTATVSAQRTMQAAIDDYIDQAGDVQEGAQPCLKAQSAAATRYFDAVKLHTACQKLNTPAPA